MKELRKQEAEEREANAMNEKPKEAVPEVKQEAAKEEEKKKKKIKKKSSKKTKEKAPEKSNTVNLTKQEVEAGWDVAVDED